MSTIRSPKSRPPLFNLTLVMLFALISSSWSAGAQTIPSDAKPLCPVSSATFASWFQTGAPSLNGVVNPADSLHFPDVPNCSFYQWSMQMFLWLTSPTPITYGGGGGRIFDSKPFFDVSPLDNTNHRHFLAHNEGFLRVFNLQAGFLGPHHLPVIFSKTHGMLEIEEAPRNPGGKPLVINRSGVAVEITRITKGTDGKAIFFDTKGKRVVRPTLIHPTATVSMQLGTSKIVQRFLIGGKPVFLDLFGNVIDVEQGEAGTGDVLQSQKGSLVYYGIAVNDVYAYFLTGVKDGQITPAPTFPTTAADLAQITTFAGAHGVTFPDPNALAIVAKTAWVEASSVPDPGDYVTMLATVPTYDTSDPTRKTWTVNGQKTVELALVGMHVVGSTRGHPEMIWATFEHLGNTPNDDYVYLNTGGQQITVNRNTSGTWLFSASNAASGFNVPHMRVDPSGNIVAVAPNTIGPSNTLRTKPWGGAMDADPNPIAPSSGNSAGSNTEIISIDNSVRGMMPAGDVRNNYILTGATWTIGGGSPAGNFPRGNSVGTSQMENSTLETYTQGQDDPTHPMARPETLFGAGANCFDCHSPGLDPRAPDALSHIFSPLSALTVSTLSVRVKVLQRVGSRHRIEVTVLDSLSGKGVSGATVSVLDSDTGNTVAHGQTATNGTVTLQYPQCRTLLDGLRGPPHFVPVPCDGSVSATGFLDAVFTAP